CTRKEDSLDVW
nr:immunoglobulin heavy chain junction region [Macaca mulatta]